MWSWSKCLVSLAAMAILASSALAADTIIDGKIKSIDGDKKKVVLTDNQGKDHTLKLDNNITVNRGGTESKGGLKVDDVVCICYDSGVVNDTVRYVLVQEGDTKKCHLMRVTIKGYDAADKKVSFTDAAEKKDWTFALNNAAVKLNGQSSKIENIKIGDPALLIIDRTKGLAEPALKAVLAWQK
jgi:hypothetical protein